MQAKLLQTFEEQYIEIIYDVFKTKSGSLITVLDYNQRKNNLAIEIANRNHQVIKLSNLEQTAAPQD